MVSVILDSKHLKMLTRARDTLDEIVETLEILSDRETMEAIKEGEEDINARRTKPFGQLLNELNLRVKKKRYNKSTKRK